MRTLWDKQQYTLFLHLPRALNNNNLFLNILHTCGNCLSIDKMGTTFITRSADYLATCVEQLMYGSKLYFKYILFNRLSLTMDQQLAPTLLKMSKKVAVLNFWTLTHWVTACIVVTIFINRKFFCKGHVVVKLFVRFLPEDRWKWCKFYWPSIFFFRTSCIRCIDVPACNNVRLFKNNIEDHSWQNNILWNSLSPKEWTI